MKLMTVLTRLVSWRNIFHVFLQYNFYVRITAVGCNSHLPQHCAFISNACFLIHLKRQTLTQNKLSASEPWHRDPPERNRCRGYFAESWFKLSELLYELSDRVRARIPTTPSGCQQIRQVVARARALSSVSRHQGFQRRRIWQPACI